MYPKVAIIVLNWNGFDDTVECLESVQKLNYNNYKVVLVDNGSDNDEGSRLKGMFSDICLIRNKTNRGFAGKNNDGINWALKNGFEYIVNLNNDCIVEKDWLFNLVNGLRSVDADFASSRIMFYPETDLVYSDGDALLLNGFGIMVNYKRKYEGKNEKRPIFGACSAASIYSGKCLQSVKIKGNQFFDDLMRKVEAALPDVECKIQINI
ncbi:MAG: glycosyltransferase [Candidatus Omnitrophota bacterium]